MDKKTNVSQLSLIKLITLKTLLDGKPKSISEINNIFCNLRSEKKGVNSISKSINRMVREGLVEYYNVTVSFSANTKNIIITQKGIEEFQLQKESFYKYLEYISAVNDFINE